MSKPIDADQARLALSRLDDYIEGVEGMMPYDGEHLDDVCTILTYINNAERATERLYAKWEIKDETITQFTFLGDPVNIDTKVLYCSRCGCRRESFQDYSFNYCPECGADMRGETE